MEEDDAHLDLKARVKRHEMRLIVQALAAEDGNQTKAARRLRVPLRTLVHKIKGFGIKREDYSS